MRKDPSSREWSGLPFRLRAFFRRGQMERELEEEMQFHLAQEAAKERRAGAEPTLATHTAQARFGRVTQHKDTTRGAWGVRLLDDLVVDLRFAVRQLFARKTFTAVAVTTLGLGIGGTVALLGVIYGLLLRPLPFEREGDLRVFWQEYSWSAAELDFARANTSVYEGLGAFTVDDQTLHRTGSAAILVTGRMSGEAFEVLGTPPLLGQTFDHSHEKLGSEPVVVLSHGFWQRELGADPEVIGSRLQLDGEQVTVAGVMPRGFFFPTPEIEIWRPLTVDPAEGDYGRNHWLVLFGRLQPDLTEAAARADLARFTEVLGQNFDYPAAWDKTKNAFTLPLREYLVGSARAPLLLVLGAVALLLLMATINVAALFLARMADRGEELTIRKAIGAGRARLARQLVTEALVLGGVASVAGLALASAGFRAIVHRLPLPSGFEHTLEVSWPLALATLLLTPLVALVVVLGPVRGLWRTPGKRRSRGALLRRRGTVGPSRSRTQGALIVGEIAIAVVLVTSATLLARTVVELYQIDLGLEPEQVAAIDLFAPSNMLDSSQRLQFFQELTERAEATSVIELASVTNRLPIRDGGVQGPITAEGRPDLDGDGGPNCKWRYVSPSYFELLGIELVEGRRFDATDRADTRGVGILGRELAERLWPGESAVGKRVQMAFADDWIEIVGVVEGVRHDGIQEPASNVLYRPLGQVAPWQAATLLVRSRQSSMAALAAARHQSEQLDPRVALARPIAMDDVVRGDLAQPLRLRFFLGLFSAMALLIGAVGVYGVVSYVVSRRTGEYGLRLALGARRPEVLLSVLREGGRLLAAGVALGLAAAFGTSFFFARLLVGVDGRDPWSYVAATAVLMGVGLLACMAPAARAARVDPSRVLQEAAPGA